MLIESLLIKGAIVLFKAAKTKTVITKVIGHSITTHGFTATAVGVGQACIVIGGIKLAADTVESLQNAIEDLKNGHFTKGAKRLARVYSTIDELSNIHSLAGAVHEIALSGGLSHSQAKQLKTDVIGLSKEIKRFAK